MMAAEQSVITEKTLADRQTLLVVMVTETCELPVRQLNGLLAHSQDSVLEILKTKLEDRN